MNQGDVLGRGIAFPPRLGEDGRWAWSAGEQSVRDSIRVILETEQRERLMLPRFGAGVRRFLFEPNTVATRHRIGERITRALGQWEPRIVVTEVSVEPDAQDPLAATATIHYQLVATGAGGRLSLGVKLAG
ncbi:MAG TPA: GPW/gp25 family protein [Polyangiaceae bacterium]